VLPSPTSVICPSDYGAYPIIERKASPYWCLTRLRLLCFVESHIVVVVDDGRDAGVEYGE
jgi:hypothetical protein